MKNMTNAYLLYLYALCNFRKPQRKNEFHTRHAFKYSNKIYQSNNILFKKHVYILKVMNMILLILHDSESQVLHCWLSGHDPSTTFVHIRKHSR